MGVGFHRFAVLPLRKPWEGNLLPVRFNREAVNRQRLFNQAPFGIHQLPQVLQRGIREGIPRHCHRKPQICPLCLRFRLLRFVFRIRAFFCRAAFLRRFCRDCDNPSFRKPLQQVLYFLTVRPVVKLHRAGLVDVEVIHLVSRCRHSEVFRLYL